MLPLDTVVEVLVFFVLEYFAVPEREIIVAFGTPQALVALRAACCSIGGLILLIVIDIARSSFYTTSKIESPKKCVVMQCDVNCLSGA